MRIDENKNIEVECEEDAKNKKFNDYSFTFNPNQLIYTKDLRHCVGLGLIQEVNNIRKRGLMHVLYNREFTRDKNKGIIVREDKLKETERVLEMFLKDFKKDKYDKNIFTDPKAILVYNRSFPMDTTVEKIILMDEFTELLNEREIEDINRYENPMAEYIKNWIEKKEIKSYILEATSNKKMPSILDMDDDPKEIDHKEFALTNNEIRVGMYNKAGVLLNPKDYKEGLKY